jgi:hypothetical protein
VTPRAAGRLFGTLGLLIIPVSLAVVFLVSCFKRGVAPLPTIATEWPQWLLTWIVVQAFVTAWDFLAGPRQLEVCKQLPTSAFDPLRTFASPAYMALRGDEA